LGAPVRDFDSAADTQQAEGGSARQKTAGCQKKTGIFREKWGIFVAKWGVFRRWAARAGCASEGSTAALRQV